MRKNGEARGFRCNYCRAFASESLCKRQIKRTYGEFQHQLPAVLFAALPPENLKSIRFKHRADSSTNFPVLPASCTFPDPCRGEVLIQGRIGSATGQRVVMPHGTAFSAQNGGGMRRTAGNDGPENFRNIGKLSELNADGVAEMGGGSRDYSVC